MARLAPRLFLLLLRGDAELSEGLLRNAWPEVIRVALRLRVVGGRDRPREGRREGDVRVDLLAGDELELVDDPLVLRVRHREKDAVRALEHRQDLVGFAHFARDDLDVL